MQIGIIGMGHIGSALATALRARGDQVGGTRRGDDNVALVRVSDVIVLCVKPIQARDVVENISGALGGKLLISICAGVASVDLRRWSGGRAGVLRAMPNTPCLIGAGMTVLASDSGESTEQLATAVNLFSSLGRTAVLPEALMDAVTGLSGCGPAYAYAIVEALTDAGVRLGIDAPTATLLAAQTLSGAAQLLLERGVPPSVLKDEVATPGGCTVEGLAALERGNLRDTLIAGVVAATRRSEELRTQASSSS